MTAHALDNQISLAGKGLAASAGFNALFGRDKTRTWKSMWLFATLLGFWFHIKAYVTSINTAREGNYAAIDKWAVVLLPVMWFTFWYYGTGYFITYDYNGRSYEELMSTSIFRIGNLFWAFPVVLLVTALAAWAYLGRVHAKYGNQHLGFGVHLFLGLGSLFMAFFLSVMYMNIAPESSSWSKDKPSIAAAHAKKRAESKLSNPQASGVVTPMVQEQPQKAPEPVTAPVAVKVETQTALDREIQREAAVLDEDQRQEYLAEYEAQKRDAALNAEAKRLEQETREARREASARQEREWREAEAAAAEQRKAEHNARYQQQSYEQRPQGRNVGPNRETNIGIVGR